MWLRLSALVGVRRWWGIRSSRPNDMAISKYFAAEFVQQAYVRYARRKEDHDNFHALAAQQQQAQSPPTKP